MQQMVKIHENSQCCQVSILSAHNVAIQSKEENPNQDKEICLLCWIFKKTQEMMANRASRYLKRRERKSMIDL